MTGVKDVTLFLVSVAIARISVGDAQCALPANGLEHPCQGSPSSRQNVLLWEQVTSPIPQPTTSVITDTIPELWDAKVLSSELKDMYVQDRSVDTASLQSLTLDGFSVVTEPPLDNATVRARLVQDYERVSVVVVFLNQSICDEHHFSFRYRLLALQSKLINILCKLQVSLIHLGAFITDDVMAANLRNCSTRADRYDRDYLIIRDTERLMDRLYREYPELIQIGSLSDL